MASNCRYSIEKHIKSLQYCNYTSRCCSTGTVQGENFFNIVLGGITFLGPFFLF
jgi:hypothetical protein